MNVPDDPIFNFKQADVFNPTFAPDVNFSNLATWFPYDFSLQSDSPAIDAGRTLTSATNSGTNSTTLNVTDARFFFDGYGIAGEGDVIQIGAADPVKIAAINYTTETIILEFARTWSNGDEVSFPFNGSAPDIGAFEAGGGNTAPIAETDNVVTVQDVAILIDVLANDTDLDMSDVLSISAVTQAVNDSVSNNGTDITYEPNIGFSGSDSFSYTVSDGNGGFDIAAVNVTVYVAGSAFQQDSGSQGIVSIEAENFDANTPRGGDSWSSVTSPAGFSGAAAMFAGPNDGDNINTDYSATSPQTDQATCWLAFALTEVKKGFRRISGYKDLPYLMTALEPPKEGNGTGG